MASKTDKGEYILLQGEPLKLTRHRTDFSVLGVEPEEIEAESSSVRPLSLRMGRVTAAEGELDEKMKHVRKERVAHHIYLTEDQEELVIDDRILVILSQEDDGLLRELLQTYHLQFEGRMGRAYILRLTHETGQNPIKTANDIGEREGVESCVPHILVRTMRRDASFSEQSLSEEQWHLSSDAIRDPEVDPSADIDIPEAWQITRGDKDVVVAVIDDGFDLGHPVFRGKALHPAMKDYGVAPTDRDPAPGYSDYHGTPVASIAIASGRDGVMSGVAPECTFLPIRVGFGRFAPQIDILEVFRHASQHADVANCSFGLAPSRYDLQHAEFRRALSELTRTGGRRKKGLVLVFAAGNDDAPTYMSGDQNRKGIQFTRDWETIHTIPKGKPVYTGYPLTPGVITVGAMSSLKRKSGFSNWGPHITVAAPSDNGHPIMDLPDGATGRSKFVASYLGKGLIAAVNRPGHGREFSPIPDDATTPAREDFYTRRFGGTSGAAPIVSGVAALMLSVNPELSAHQVKQILMATADQNLDVTLDLEKDPNIAGNKIQGDFIQGRSAFFGSGKVNAYRAVQRARALDPSVAAHGSCRGSKSKAASAPAVHASRFGGSNSHADLLASGQTQLHALWKGLQLAPEELQAMAAFQQLRQILEPPAYAPIRALELPDLSSICALVQQVKGPLQIILPLIEKIPVYGANIAFAIRSLLQLLEAACKFQGKRQSAAGHRMNIPMDGEFHLQPLTRNLQFRLKPSAIRGIWRLYLSNSQDDWELLTRKVLEQEQTHTFAFPQSDRRRRYLWWRLELLPPPGGIDYVVDVEIDELDGVGNFLNTTHVHTHRGKASEDEVFEDHSILLAPSPTE